MPGLSLVRTEGDLDDRAIDRSCEAVRFFEGDACREIHRTTDTVLLATAYDDYPVHVVETDDAVVALGDTTGRGSQIIK